MIHRQCEVQMSSMKSAAILTALLMSTSASHALNSSDGAGFNIRSITLSSGGLAEITGVEKINGSGRIDLEIPADQIDDILKSLIVIDAKGSVSGITLGGPAAIDETFKTLPFSADDLQDVSKLAAALQGVRVKISKPLEDSIEGEVLGVAVSNGKDGKVEKTLSVLTGGAIRTTSITDDLLLEVLDPVINQKITDAVSALRKGKGDGAKSVAVHISGNTARDVAVSYVVPAAVWKTSFRMITSPGGDKARIQGWAVVENTTGSDWKDVSLKLSSGSPVALRQNLHQHYWKDRREVPIGDPVLGSLAPHPTLMKRSAILDRESSVQSAVPPRAPGLAMMAAPAMANVSAPERSIDANQGDVSVSYAVPHPVTLSAGDTLSLPIIDTEIKAERVSLYRDGSGRHPQAAIKITNTSGATLPSGIMTIYDKGDGYVGDSDIPALRASGSKTMTFASDTKVEMDVVEKPVSVTTKMTVSDGVLKSSVVSSVEREYRITGAPDGGRTIMIDHQGRPGWTAKSDADIERNGSGWIVTKKIPAAQDAVIKIIDESTNATSFRLLDADEATLKQWSTAAGDPSVSEKLKKVVAAKADLETAARALRDIEGATKRLTDDQARIRENLKAVPEKSDAAIAYTKKMMEIDAALEQTENARTKAKAAVDQKDNALRSVIRNL